jgi:hypothetical protein
MRTFLRLFALTLVLGLPAAAGADEQQPPKKADEPAASTPWYKELPPPEACWGDSNETDDVLNEGSRITTEEILRILNPAQS